MSDLQQKDIINVMNGAKLGKIVDIEVSNEGVITYLIVSEVKMMRRVSGAEARISFKQIKRIGSDVILVEL